MTKDQLPVLAAEDEESDAIILRLGFQKAGLANPLLIVRDGQEAVDYLAGKGPYGDRASYPFPALVLLDLKMPRMSGFDVLAWLSAHSEFKDLPLVVLSSSSDDSDREKARRMGASEYFVKPHSLFDLANIVQDLAHRWLTPANPKPEGQR